jgi:hypothetical protein
MEAAGQQLLDFNQPFDVGLLDTVVEAFYDPRNTQVGSQLVAFERPKLTTWFPICSATWRTRF